MRWVELLRPYSYWVPIILHSAKIYLMSQICTNRFWEAPRQLVVTWLAQPSKNSQPVSKNKRVRYDKLLPLTILRQPAFRFANPKHSFKHHSNMCPPTGGQSTSSSGTNYIGHGNLRVAGPGGDYSLQFVIFLINLKKNT